MKKTLFLALCLINFSITQGQDSSNHHDMAKLNWMQGTWVSTNPKPGRTLHEHWGRFSADELRGYSISMRGSDTLSFERMRILIKDQQLYFVADVPENKASVYFSITKVDDNGFACENQSHDFPKQINYQVSGNTLKATISGNGKSIDYFFERSKTN